MIATWLLTAKVVGAAMVGVMGVGVPLGYWLARGRSRWRSVVDVMVALPLVLPPTVTGYYLLTLLGRRGVVGRVLERCCDVRLVFTFPAAVIAAMVVSLPLMTKGAESAFLRVDAGFEEMARVHGLSRWQTFAKVTAPLSGPALAVAVLLAGLRATGEFGATLVFAGYVPGETSTVPLEIYMALQSGDDLRARALVLSLSGFAVLATLAMTVWGRK